MVLTIPSALVLSPVAGIATQLNYINNGAVIVPPQIDAINFVNKGTFNIVTIDPFTTSSTLNYSNLVSSPGAGVMTGTPGWIFDWEPINLGVPRAASSFFNDNLGRIEAVDATIPLIIIGEPFPSLLQPSKLFVSATNIVSNGALVVGANGWLRLAGDHVDLTRSLLEVNSVQNEAQGSYNAGPLPPASPTFGFPPAGFFLPDVAVSDLYWGQTNLTFDSAIIWNGGTASTPIHPVQGPLGAGGTFQFSITTPDADSYIAPDGIMSITITNGVDTNSGIAFTTNVFLLTNVVKQAVFVGTAPRMTMRDGFTPSSTPFTNHYQTIGVLLSVPLFNTVTALPETANIYIRDTLASETPRGLLTNLVTTAGARPANYIVSRLNEGLGAPGNNGYPFDPNFFLDSGNFDANILSDTVTNSRITGAYGAYAAFFDNIVSEPTTLVTGTVTNLPGRVHIFANSLDLTKTRIRGEGEVIVQTPHLISSTETVIDCQNLSFNLGSTNQNLTVQSVAGNNVARMTGNIFVWSGQWSNSVVTILNNFAITNIVTPGTNPPSTSTTNFDIIPAPVTNIIGVFYHTLMVNASAVRSTVPVNVYDLIMHSTNAVVNDNMRIVESFFTDAQRFTLNANITFSSATLQNDFGPVGTVSLTDWIFTNAPNLLYFTNNNTLTIPNESHFGDDRAVPYSEFINNGGINAYSIQLNSADFENNGAMIAQGPMLMSGGSGKLQNGSSSAGGVAWFSCDSLKFNNQRLSVNGHAYFNVTNALFDTGAGSGNTFKFQDGFNLLIKPSTGDLLGTTFQTVAPNLVAPSVEVDHVWAGEDRGTNAEGYLNNEAIGQLVLSSPSVDPLFVFSGTTNQNENGLYVDLLDLSALTDYTNQIQINPNLTIYYAAAKLNVSVTLPPLTEPEEFLNGQFGGHLKWVSCFAGPNSSQDVVIGSQSVSVNAALRNSHIIDSDGDGLVNGNDPFPFASAPCGATPPAAHMFVSINSPAQGQSVVQTSAVVQGSAGTTNGSMAWVYYQVNSNGWTPASSLNGGANWSGALNLAPGNNTVPAYAQDSQGNKSSVATINVALVPGAALAVQINGAGTVVSNYNGQLLALGQTYTMTAYPDTGYAFSNWTSSAFLASQNPQLTFLMKSNLVIVANFVAQSFVPSAASYSGLFYQTDGVQILKSGSFSATTAGNGKYSGTLQLAAGKHSFSGKFNSEGLATNQITLSPGSQLVMVLQIDISDNKRITGTVSSGSWVAELEALRGVSGGFAGNYTFIIPGTGDAANPQTPSGDSYAMATVKPGATTVQASLFLADGQPNGKPQPQLTESANLAQDGRWPLYASLYQGKGQILGWLTFTNTDQADLTGWVSWIKPAISGAKYYPAGFDIETNGVTGSAYHSTTNPVTIFANGMVLLTDGNLAASVSNNVAVGLNNKVANLGGNSSKLTVTLTPAKGLFTGTVTPTNSAAAIKFNGVILQKQQMGAGYFLGTNQSGQVFFGP